MESSISLKSAWTNSHLNNSQNLKLFFFFHPSTNKMAIFWMTLDYSVGGGSLWWRLIRNTSHPCCQSSTCGVPEISTFLSASHRLSCLSFHLPISSSFNFLCYPRPVASSRTQTRPFTCTTVFISPHAATNDRVNRSINRETRGRQRVNRQDSLREVKGTKEERRGGEGGEEGRGHLIEMEIEQAN